jgi:hypothetical protein
MSANIDASEEDNEGHAVIMKKGAGRHEYSGRRVALASARGSTNAAAGRAALHLQDSAARRGGH